MFYTRRHNSSGAWLCVIVVRTSNLFMSFVEMPLEQLLLVVFMQSAQAHHHVGAFTPSSVCSRTVGWHLHFISPAQKDLVEILLFSYFFSRIEPVERRHSL